MNLCRFVRWFRVTSPGWTSRAWARPFAEHRVASWRSEPGSQRVAQSGICAVPHPGDVSIGSDQYCSGGCYLPQDRKLPIAGIFGVDQLNPICPWSDVEAAGLTEVE